MTFERIRFTEALDLDMNGAPGEEAWHCHDCGHRLIAAHENYKKGCLVADRDPREIHAAIIDGPYSFAPDPEWVRVLEFYCPECAKQIETEYLPPGHPITHDIELDVGSLRSRLASGDMTIVDGKLLRAAGVAS